MNLDQAYKILEVDKNAPKEQIKKSFKKLAAKYHPDVNKEPGAEAKFKEINTAYETVSNPPKANPFSNNEYATTSRHYGYAYDYDTYNFNFNDFFQDSFKSTSNRTPQGPSISFPTLTISLTISFEESVLGCQKKIDIKRQVPCGTCNGIGKESISENKCTECKGLGRATKKIGSVFVMTTCEKCKGLGQTYKPCKPCNETGCQLEDRTVDVAFKGGITSGQTARIPGAGHFHRGGIFNQAGFDDILVKIHVQNHPKMRLTGLDIYSKLDVSLLEALEGAEKKIQTVRGEQQIKIAKNSKAGDKIKIAKQGADNGKHIGNHIIILDVKYPNDTEKLIEFLKSQNT